jgi:phage/plasmid-like protein (TIGR03299 family)
MAQAKNQTRAYAQTVGTSLLAQIGVQVDAQISGPELMKAAALDFTVEKTPSYVATSDAELAEFVRIPGQYGLMRVAADGSRKPFPASVGDVYRPFQNADLFAFGDRIIAATKGRARWQQAGGIDEGRRVFGILDVPAGEIVIERWNGQQDRSGAQLLLHNAHDGRSSISGAFLATRLWCTNQLSASLRSRHAVVIRHTESAEQALEQAVRVLGAADRYFAEHRELAQRLADTPMSERDFSLFAAQVLTRLDDPAEAADAIQKSEGRSRTILERKGAELLELFQRGLGNFGHDRYDALNAITEWIDHQHSRIARYKSKASQLAGQIAKGAESAHFGGHGAEVKARALRLLAR